MDLKALLRRGVEQGYWTVEAIDRPSSGFATCTHVDRETFPNGYVGVEHRNMLRDSLQAQTEAVEVISDKDLPPMAHGVTPAYAPKLPLTLDETKGPSPVPAGGTTHAANEYPHQPDQLPAAVGSQALPW